MPHFYFHTIDGGRQVHPDRLACDDEGAARREAVRYAGAVLHDEPELLQPDRDFRVEVTDQDQRLVFTIVTLAMDGHWSAPIR